MQGRIAKWYGGFGFIRFDGRDIFVHNKNFMSGSFPELNSIVEFRLGPATREDRPDQAVNVKIVKRAADVLDDFERRAGIEALRNTKIDTLSDGTKIVRYESEPGGAG